ncbi:MAG: SPASM domain-containing protein [Syntrophobacteraceae bacterium]
MPAAGLLDLLRIEDSPEATPAETLHHLSVADGQTRDCLDPWGLASIQATGEVAPCCFGGNVGNLSADGTLENILNGPEIIKYRKGLLTGDIISPCRSCPSKGLVNVKGLLQKVKDYLAYAERL